MTLTRATPLRGKTAIVTGAAGGIGKATVHKLQLLGAVVHGIDIESSGVGVDERSHICDLTDSAALEGVLTRIGDVDVVVCAAGINVPERSLESVQSADWDRVLAVNVTSQFRVIKATLATLRENHGYVVVIASVAAEWPDPVTGPAYQASKSAVAALALACAAEEHLNGVRFTVVSPGLVDTPLLSGRPGGVPASLRELALQPEDIAATIGFLVTLPRRVLIPRLTVLPTALQTTSQDVPHSAPKIEWSLTDC